MKYLAFFSGLGIGLIVFLSCIFVPEKSDGTVMFFAVMSAVGLCGWALNMHEREKGIIRDPLDDEDDEY